MDFIAIDFETANQSRNSACAVGLVVVRKDRIVDSFYSLIRPPQRHFSPICTAVHGLTWSDVEGAPDFDMVWDQIGPIIDGEILVAHNAGFDISVLRAALNHYGLDTPDIRYACSLAAARKQWPHLESHKLESLCLELGISPGNHVAVEDARAAAEVMLKIFPASFWSDTKKNLSKLGVPIHQIASCEWHDEPVYGKQELERTLNTIDGIIRGILIDGKITADERNSLVAWYSEHRELADKYPIKEIVVAIDHALRTGKVDKEDLEEIQELVGKINHEFYSATTADIQKLYGILHGVLSDNKLTFEEIKGLQEWIDQNEHLQSCYPYDTISKMTKSILENGGLTADESGKMAFFFKKILSDSGATEVMDASSVAEAALSSGHSKKSNVASLPWSTDPVEFSGKTFVLTGESELGSRAEIEEQITSRGGMVSGNVSKKVDYLVVGGAGNPKWAFSKYGKKIEAALSLIAEGKKISIIKDQWLF